MKYKIELYITALAIITVLSVAYFGSGSTESTVAEHSEKELIVWNGYYKALVNMKYYELSNDDRWFHKWSIIRDKYAAYIGKENDTDMSVFDDLYVQTWWVQKYESEPDMALLRQAQESVDADYNNGRLPVWSHN